MGKLICKKRYDQDWVFLVFIGITAFITFILIYGMLPLNVSYDKWIFEGFAEVDILQDYAGFMGFRNSAWTFPFGVAKEIGYPNGISIIHTNSSPYYAVLFKILNPILPQTFQYFGWEVLLCFIMNGILGYKILRLFLSEKVNCYIGSMFFLISPILIERAFRHSALANHFIILLAIFLYLKSRKENYRVSKMWIFLSFVSVGIHMYFVPLVFMFLVLNLVEASIHNKHIFTKIGFLFINLISSIFSGWILGLFTQTYQTSGCGYGFYGMNANALINPTSLDIFSENTRIVWSNFLPVLPQVYGNYDGFNYLGIGFMLLIIVGCIYWIINMIQNKKEMVYFVKRNFFLFLACLFILFFALSYNANFGERNLYVIDFCYEHVKLYSILSMFRSSGRFFYAVYYLMIISGLISIFRNSHKLKYGLLVIMLIIQIVDIFPALKHYHTYFSEKVEISTNYSSSFWWNIPEQYTKFWVLNNESSYFLGYIAAKNELRTNNNFGNRRNIEVEEELVTEKRAEILREDLEDDALYIFIQREDYERFVNSPNERPYDIFCVDGLMVLANFNVDLRHALGENDQIINRANIR